MGYDREQFIQSLLHDVDSWTPDIDKRWSRTDVSGIAVSMWCKGYAAAMGDVVGQSVTDPRLLAAIRDEYAAVASELARRIDEQAAS